MIQSLTGTNSFLLHAALRMRIADFVAEQGDMALEQLDGEDVSLVRISEAVQSLPFLASKKLVILHSPSAQKQFAEQVAELLADVPETTELVLVEPKPDKRTAFYKWLKNHTEFLEYRELDERQLSQWVVQYATEQGSTINMADASYLIARVGANQQRLSQELQKLSLQGGVIARERINALTEATPDSKIFDLLDAAFNGRTARALELYKEQRSMRVEPQEILAMVGWQLRQVSLAKTAGKHDLVREGKISPYSATKSSSIASRLSLLRLKQLVRDLTVLDARSKRSTIDLDEALQNYILRLSY
jgi:DNA polymerase-3 subunit delta